MKFSIIVPVYNAEKYLEKCIDSLLKQNIKDYEIIFVNDCSKDNSKKIIEEKLKNIDNIVILDNEQNLGLSDTRNKGISVAKGEYIIFVDSDDYIETNVLLDIFTKLKENNFPDIMYFGFYEENGEYVEKKRGFKCETNRLYDAYDFMKVELKKRNLYAPACFATYKRTFILNNNLHFESGLLHEDELWTPNALLSAKTVYVGSDYFYHYVRHSNSITRSKDNTKNGLDLKQIAVKIDAMANKLSDNELKLLLREHAARLYMKAISVGKLYRKEYKKKVERSFPIKRARNLYDKFKAILFFANTKLYYTINRMIGK